MTESSKPEQDELAASIGERWAAIMLFLVFFGLPLSLAAWKWAVRL